MKRIVSLIIVLILVLSFTFSVSAENSSLFIDEAALINDTADAKAINDELQNITDKSSFTAYIITVMNFDEEYIEDFTKSYCEKNGLDENCVGLIVSIGNRKLDVFSRGEAQKRFDATRREYIYNEIFDYLKADDFSGAFHKFTSVVSDFTGDKISDEQIEKERVQGILFSGTWIIISLGVGFVVSLIICTNIKKKLKTVDFAKNASQYVKPGSMVLKNQSDQFLYFTINRVRKPKDEGKGGMHSSSGGGFGHTSGSF